MNVNKLLDNALFYQKHIETEEEDEKNTINILAFNSKLAFIAVQSLDNF